MDRTQYYRYLTVERGVSPESALQTICKQYGRTKPAEVEDIRREVGAPAAPPARIQPPRGQDQ
jgi:hypothetical protein